MVQLGWLAGWEMVRLGEKKKQEVHAPFAAGGAQARAARGTDRLALTGRREPCGGEEKHGAYHGGGAGHHLQVPLKASSKSHIHCKRDPYARYHTAHRPNHGPNRGQTRSLLYRVRPDCSCRDPTPCQCAGACPDLLPAVICCCCCKIDRSAGGVESDRKLRCLWTVWTVWTSGLQLYRSPVTGPPLGT
eukprot:COSAG01_NODE_1295_length_10874_cov_10.154710_1_plen_189_part_00